MSHLPSSPASAAASQAAAVLRAWNSGDPAILSLELERSEYVSPLCRNGGGDEEVELLKTLTGRMQTLVCKGREHTPDLEVGVCLSLLGHLASLSAETE